MVVFFSIDTLGQTLANQTDLCGDMRGLSAFVGLSTACVEGGIAPSSWTGEAHTRLLWPMNRHGTARANQYPTCGQRSARTPPAPRCQRTGGRPTLSAPPPAGPV